MAMNSNPSYTFFSWVELRHFSHSNQLFYCYPLSKSFDPPSTIATRWPSKSCDSPNNRPRAANQLSTTTTTTPNDSSTAPGKLVTPPLHPIILPKLTLFYYSSLCCDTILFSLYATNLPPLKLEGVGTAWPRVCHSLGL
jgi:hypothetical protein